MTQFRTIDLQTAYAATRHPLRRYAPPAALLSQMLQHKPQVSQPAHAPESIATRAYAYTEKASILRMPAGYRTTVFA